MKIEFNTASLCLKGVAVFFITFLCIESTLGQGFSLHTYYSPQEYGSHVQNWTAAKDTNGFIYIGNGSGLITFNGVEWEGTHIGETGRGNSIFTSSTGKIYASGSTDFGYLAPDSTSSFSYESISQKFYSEEERVPGQFETYEQGGSLFFRHSWGINKYDGQNLTKFGIDKGILGHSARMADSILIGAPRGIVSFSLDREGSFNFKKGSEIFAGKHVWIANNYKPGHVLFGDWGNLLIDYDGSSFRPFITEVDGYLREHRIYDFEVISDSVYAIATLSGGVVFINEKGELLKMFTEKNGLATNQVYDLYFDEEKILWLGLQKGIQKLLLDETLIIYNESSGLNDIVTGFAFNAQKVFVNTTFGLFRGEVIQPERTMEFTEVDTPESIVHVFSWKNLFYALSSNGLYKIDEEGSFEKLINDPYLIKVKSKYETDRISFVNQTHLIHFDGSRFEKLSLPDIHTPGDALLTGDSLFVLNPSTGLQLVVNGTVTSIPFGTNEEAINLYNEIDSINNDIYVAVEGDDVEISFYKFEREVSFMSNEHFLSKIPEFNSNQVVTFQQCSDSEIWFIGGLRIVRIFKEAKEWKLDESSFGLLNGGSASEIINTINCESNGVWFGGTIGLFHLKEPDFNYDTDFKTNITGIYINRDSLIYGGFGEPQQPIILPYANNELRFSYAAASYVAPDRNQYQVKLEGFDSDWSTWTSETQKDYTNIPEGEYMFRVRSKNVYDVAGIADAIPFEILPPWYRTWWAYLLYTFTIAGILYLAYKIRINQILRVQRIRNNIASDLHDEVSATLSSISYFAEAIKSDKVKKDKNRFVNLIANSADDAKEKITDIVWAINPEHDDWPAFLSKCRRFTSDLLESKEMEYSLKIDEFIPGKLDMQLRQHLWLIFKEMVTNAVRHSKATQLDVIMKYEEGELKLVVQDNGEGMDVDSVRKGNGLVNIHKRAEQIDGEISLKTSEGFGTRWMLKVPL
ncbi:sensor histidine kinase [Gracilimonas sp. BCB1]|uniref:sensor histidine kinase n=1 Tax=Gracilimonas sp. BCB1 TaxID=3152362 RepID=UPI0032D8D551